MEKEKDMEVDFYCVDERSAERYIKFKIAEAIDYGKTVEHITPEMIDLNNINIDKDVYIISNAEHFSDLRNFIIKCETFNKSVIVIYTETDVTLFEKNILPAIPLCDSISKSPTHKKNKLPQIVLLTGPMRGGKSQEVLRLINQCTVLKMKILCLTPKIDERSGAKIKSRNGCESPSICLEKLDELDKNVYNESEVIVIDEAQFFPDLYSFVNQCKNDNKTVFISGLDGDFNRKPFGQVLNCIPLCDTISKFRALCMIKNDGTPAIFSMLVADQTLLKEGNKLVGDSQFLSVSREEYIRFTKKIKNN